jgi:hypothetical protein
MYLPISKPDDTGCFQSGNFLGNHGVTEFEPLGDFLWPLRNLQEVQRAEDPERWNGSGGAYGSECIGVHDFKP